MIHFVNCIVNHERDCLMFFYGNEGEAYFSSYYLLFLQMHIADRDVKKN